MSQHKVMKMISITQVGAAHGKKYDRFWRWIGAMGNNAKALDIES